MKIYLKDVKPLGFRGTGMFEDSKWHHHYFAFVEGKFGVKAIIIDALHDSVSHFNLSLKDYRDFKKNKVSLVPRGCCNASGGRYIEHPILDMEGDFEQVFGNKKNFIEYLKRLTASLVLKD